MVLSEDEEEKVLLDAEINKLYQIHRTVMQMLKDRGYVVEDFEINMSMSQFISNYGEKMKRKDLIIKKAKQNDSSDQICVIFPNAAEAGVKKMKAFTDCKKSENVFRGILVIQQNLARSARKFLSEDISPNFHWELFQEDELLVNVTHHVLVPQHQVLTSEEKKALLERYSVKEPQVCDPIARYYGVKHGEVVMITRPSESADRYVTFHYAV